MLKPLRYFFLRVYELKRSTQPDLLAVLTAVAVTSAAVFTHLLTLWILFDRAIGSNIARVHDRNASRAVGVVIIILIAAAFYRAWVASGKYLKFEQEFGGETIKQRDTRTVFVVLYAATSFLLPVALMIALSG